MSGEWYGSLEKDVEDAPSPEVFGRFSRAPMLSEAERQHLQLHASGATAELARPVANEVPAKLQRTLDALRVCPAYIQSTEWDVVAWNWAARVALHDFQALAPNRRNLLLILFCDPSIRRKLRNWGTVARSLVWDLRHRADQAGMSAALRALVDEVSAESPEFAEMWRDAGSRNSCDGSTIIDMPNVGSILLDYSQQALRDHPGMTMVIYTPASSGDSERLTDLLATRIGNA